MTIIAPARYWRGQEPLWKAYWLVGVPGTLGFAALFALIFRFNLARPALVELLLGSFVVFSGFAVLIVWRCADNVRNPTWGAIARALTVAWVLNVLLLAGFMAMDIA